MDSYADKLKNWKDQNLYRTWKPYPPLLQFSSNDYLGLSQDPRLRQAAIEAIDLYGVGSKASRAVSGTLPLHEEIEVKLASFFKKEQAILFNSGYQCNSTVVKTLSDEKTLLLLDHDCHRSLIEGAYNSKACVKRFHHNDPSHLEDLLKKYRSSYSTCWIITESLFSMDGTIAPLEEIILLKNRFQSYLMVDDAHAIGALGNHGEGLGIGADLVVGTFGKAFGSFGAFVATSAILADYLRQFCPGLIYTTSLPPQVLGPINKALEIIPAMDQERAHLKALCDYMGSRTYIIPWKVPLEMVSICEKQGILVHPIRPPTVTVPIIRITLNTTHTLQDLARLKTILIESN